MADSGNSTHVTSIRVIRLALGIEEVFKKIVAMKKTGSLTIHFSQGGVGALEWSEKKREACSQNTEFS